jgi:hypothetical protein
MVAADDLVVVPIVIDTTPAIGELALAASAADEGGSR